MTDTAPATGTNLLQKAEAAGEAVATKVGSAVGAVYNATISYIESHAKADLAPIAADARAALIKLEQTVEPLVAADVEALYASTVSALPFTDAKKTKLTAEGTAILQGLSAKLQALLPAS